MILSGGATTSRHLMEVLGNSFGCHDDWEIVTGIELVGSRMIDV